MNIRISYIKCESRMGETGRPTGRAPRSVKFAATVALLKLRLNGLIAPEGRAGDDSPSGESPMLDHSPHPVRAH